MANSITLFKKFIDKLDEVYKQSAKTSILDGDSSLVQMGANANEIIIPKISMDGLADYSRNGGYVDGDVTLTNETVQFNYDRGRAFSVDAMDNEETAGIAFGKLASEFIRTKVVPELDAFRFAKYAGLTGISKVSAGATLSTGADVISALRVAITKMDEDEVPMEDRHLFITPTLHGLIQDMDTTKSREVMGRFADAILTNNHIPHISIFITAPERRRIQRFVEINQNITVKQAKKWIESEDKRHLKTYKFYTGRKWSKASNYDLCINSASYGIQGSVDLILRMLKANKNDNK